MGVSLGYVGVHSRKVVGYLLRPLAAPGGSLPFDPPIALGLLGRRLAYNETPEGFFEFFGQGSPKLQNLP